MRAWLVPLLACPDCASALHTVSDAVRTNDDAVVDGPLACAGCARQFPIVDGIASLMPTSLLPEQVSEIAARDAQVSDYDAMWFLNLFGLLEIPMTIRRLDVEPDHVVLEAGAGTGRMTHTIADYAGRLVSVDFSMESLRANAKKLLDRKVDNVELIQADLCHLPFKAGSFDRVVSCQVLEHVPGDEARQAAVVSLSRSAKPDATVVISAYQHSLFTREKHGSHDGGIPFFRFTRSELRDLLGTRFRVRSITGKLVYLYLADCSNKVSLDDESPTAQLAADQM